MPLLAEVPQHYSRVCRKLTLSGYRVLALACKEVPDTIDLSIIPRDEVESQLTFVGFLVVSTPIKHDSATVVQVRLLVLAVHRPASRLSCPLQHLQSSSHNVVMITGDDALTAVSIARVVSIIPNLAHKVLAPCVVCTFPFACPRSCLMLC